MNYLKQETNWAAFLMAMFLVPGVECFKNYSRKKRQKQDECEESNQCIFCFENVFLFYVHGQLTFDS
jgi:hypothetical protein